MNAISRFITARSDPQRGADDKPVTRAEFTVLTNAVTKLIEIIDGLDDPEKLKATLAPALEPLKELATNARDTNKGGDVTNRYRLPESDADEIAEIANNRQKPTGSAQQGASHKYLLPEGD